MKRAGLVAAIGGAAVIAIAAFVLASRPDGKRPEAPQVSQVALGSTVYVQYCAACHGANLEGQPDWRKRKPDGRLPAPPHDATGHTWEHSDEVLFRVTKEGFQTFAGPNYKTDMPAFGASLKDEEIWAVIAFIKSRWPPHLVKRQELQKATAYDRAPDQLGAMPAASGGQRR